MTSRFVALLALLVPLIAPAEEELLAPEEAFQFRLEATGPDSVRATWEVADGYYLYRDKLDFKSETEGLSLGEPSLPPGKVKNDEFFGKVETYRGQVSADIPIERAAGAHDSLTIDAGSQGCADLGVCYPPHRQKATVRLASAESAAASNARETLGGAGGGSFGGEDEVLDPDVAFVFSTEVVDGNTLVARWDIEPEHYLYRDKLNFELKDSEGVSLGTPQVPKGEEKNDEFFGLIQVFHDEVEVRLPLSRDNLEATGITLVARYQGCAEAGICYPPMEKKAELTLPVAAASESKLAEEKSIEPAPVAPDSDEPLSEQDSLAQSLATGSTSLILGTFFGLGLLLAFTPCVFPMIPILSSIIVGQGEGLTTRKAFTLSSVYVLAMAVTYTVAGVIAGLFGANLQAAFQDPWILSAFAAVFVLLSLSMFGFYELQLPSRWQSKLSEVSNRQEGGSLTGVAIMGLLSALIVGPCVAPPLMGALIYIGQTGDPWLGGAALFALSLGMGAPLVAIGTAGGKLLPRAGNWMDAVKAVFGVLLLAVAIWMLERILPAWVTMLMWSLLAVVSAIYMGALESIHEGASGWRRLFKGLGVVLLIYGTLLLIGVSSGARDPLTPLGQMRFAGGVGGTFAAQPAHVEFESVKSVADLKRAVESATQNGQPVMLDFYADWCVSCKEFEKYTFSDPQVISALSGTRLLQADVTANDEADKALLKELGLFGPPAILFWDENGEEKRNYRVVGFMEADKFTSHVERAIGK